VTKLTIHSDGTPSGTIVMTESGEVIDYVSAVDFSISTGMISTIRLELSHASVILTGELEGMMVNCWGCGESVEHECNPKLNKNPASPTPLPSPAVAKKCPERDSQGKACGGIFLHSGPCQFA